MWLISEFIGVIWTHRNDYQCYVIGKWKNGKLTQYPENRRKLDNGVEYSFVEVTCSDGIQYGLQAYGAEAISLYKETLKTLGKNT